MSAMEAEPAKRPIPSDRGEPVPSTGDVSDDVSPPSQRGCIKAIVPQRPHVETHPTGKRLAFLSLAALGIVYGDIGTSPLYALRECFKPEYGLDARDPGTVVRCAGRWCSGR